jgi:hypothetical protein
MGIIGKPEIGVAQQFLKERNTALMKRNVKYLIKQFALS